MPESWIIIVDNSYHSQNQDYLPTRLLAQAEVARSLASRKLNDSPENKVGVFPLCIENFRLITPTRSNSEINDFLSKLDLFNFTSCPIDLSHRTFKLISTDRKVLKTIVLMIGMKMNDSIAQTMLESIQKALSNGVYVKICFFGESVEYVPFFEEKITSDSFAFILADPDEDLYQAVLSVCDETAQEFEDDPDLALAMQLSMEEANKNKQ